MNMSKSIKPISKSSSGDFMPLALIIPSVSLRGWKTIQLSFFPVILLVTVMTGDEKFGIESVIGGLPSATGTHSRQL